VTILETIIAMVIAIGVVAGALEAAGMATARTALARLRVEAAAEAEGLLAKVGTEVPLAAGTREGMGEGGVAWSLAVNPYQPVAKGPQAFDVVAHVEIRRGGLVVREDLATLKLLPERAP
jgi:type II secretory pathway pseudopilin PulG